MKKIIFGLIILAVSSQLLFSQDSLKVLFIGNSHTYYNDLPSMFEDFAIAGGKKVIVSSVTMGGATLQDHSNNSTTISKIYSDDWDYVVLQEQSQIPSWENDRESMMYPYAYKLDSMIHDNNNCSQTIFFMTWAHKPGDLEILYNGGTDTFEDMQQRLYDGYMEIADSLEAIVAPVGWAWQEVIHTDNSIELYRTDEYHPLVKGTYLAASTFYSTIFKEAANTVLFYDTLDVGIAQLLQTAASNIVMDSLELWNIGLFDTEPLSGFSYNLQGTEYLFTDTSTNAILYLWNFGDGTTSNLQNPTHTFSESGIHHIQQIVYNDCGSDTAYISIDVVTSIEIKSNRFRLFPNPTTGRFVVNANNIESIEILDITGRLVKQLTTNTEQLTIDLSHNPKGIYFVKVKTKIHQCVEKVILE